MKASTAQMSWIGNLTMKLKLIYKCKRCGENLHMEDVVKHIVIDHDQKWRGSFYDAFEEYYGPRLMQLHKPVMTSGLQLSLFNVNK
jgi:hypothetical protein